MSTFQETTKTTKELATLIGQLSKSANSLAASLLKINESTKKQAKSQADLKAKTKGVQTSAEKLAAIEKERITLLNKLNKANSTNIDKNEVLKVQNQQQAKINKQLAREKLGLIGAYEKESKKLLALKKRYKDVVISQGANSKSALKLKKEYDKLNKKVRDADKASGDYQKNVGNYPGVMGRAQSGVQGLNTAFKAMLANPIVAVVAALVGAFIALKAALKRSEEGQNALAKISAALGAALDVIMDIVTSLAENMIKAFEDPQQAVKDLWEVIKTNLVNRIEGVANIFIGLKDVGVASFKLLGASIKNVFSDNQQQVDELKGGVVDAAEDMGRALWQATSGLDVEQQKALAQGFKNIVEDIKVESDAAAKLAKREGELAKKTREALVREGEIRRDIFKLREEAAKKESTTAAERIILLDEAIALENELLDVNSEIALEKYAIKAAQNALGASTIEDLNEEAQLKRALIDLDALAAKKRRTLITEQQTAIREAAAEEEKVMQEVLASLDVGIEELLKEEAELSDAALNESLARAAEARKKAAEEELALVAETEAKKSELKKAAWDATQTIITDQFNAGIDEKLARFQDANEAEQEILKDKLDKGLISEKEYEKKSGALKLKARQEQAKAEKKKALFEIAIATAVALINQLRATPLPLGAVPVALVAAIGAIQLAAVAAKPIPRYKQGGVHKGGVAQFSEEGKELAILPSGEAFLTPDEIAQGFIPKGTEFFSHNSPETQAAISGGMTEEMYNGLIKEQQLTRSAIGSQTKHITKLTDAGLEKVFIKKGVSETYLDEWVRL